MRFKKNDSPIDKRKDLRKIVRDIINLYNSGRSSNKIANDFNCSHQTIIQLLKENNIPINKKRSASNSSTKKENRTLETISKIKSLINNGMACKEIGRIIGCSGNTIKRILLENNIPIPKYIRSEKTRKIISGNTKRFMNDPNNKEILKGYLKKRGCHMWTKEEDTYLIKNYNNKFTKDLSKYLGIKEYIIKERLSFLKLKRKDISKIKSATSQGVNLENWKGFSLVKEYDKLFNTKFKRQIRERDNQICILCNLHREKLKKALHIHHIDYNKKNTTKENCCALCNQCHTKTNFNRKQWIQFFQSLLLEKYGYEYNNPTIIINEKGGIK